MSIKGTVSSAAHGHGLWGIALAVGIGMGLVAPFLIWAFNAIKNKVAPAKS